MSRLLRKKLSEYPRTISGDIALVRSGLPPIGTAFFKVGESVPTESPQPESFPETDQIVPHDQI